MTDYELRRDELEILAAACRMADELTRLEGELADAPTLTAGSAGQLKPNPLFGELRQHRLAIGRLLGQLGLNDASEDEVGQLKSGAGRRLALFKHQRRFRSGT